ISAISAVQASKRAWSSGVMASDLWVYSSILPPAPVFAKVGYSRLLVQNMMHPITIRVPVLNAKIY
ncbi:MAG: hypothetical protein ACFE0I_14280, partial [Elainellaceae cyanobacterium]